jgi:hypothetical protein
MSSPVILSYQSQKVPTTLSPDVCADGDALVLTPVAGAFADHEIQELPNRCVTCNRPADASIDVKLVWLPPDGLPPVAVRRAWVRFWFCEKHASNYRRSAWVGTCVFGAGVITLAIGFPLSAIIGIGTDESRELLAAALLAAALFMTVLGGILMGLWKIKALWIDRKTIQIGGCGKPFLNSLPPLRAATQESCSEIR